MGMVNVFWEKDIETLDRIELEKYQIKILKKSIENAYSCEYYKRVFSEKKIDSDKINSIDDLKKIPFTTKQDLRSGFPDGFIAVDKSKIVRVHSSSGTTGQATAIYHTQRDLNTWTNLVARSLYMAGFRKTDIFQNMMGYGLFTGGLGLHYGAERLGMMVIPVSSGNSHRQLELMQQYKSTGVHIIPSYAFYLYTYFQKSGLDPKKDTHLKKAVIGAEPHTEEMRKKIEELYGIDAYNCYGLSEMNGPGVGFECPEKNGIHLWEDNYIVEIINPITLEPVKDGDEGELVLTILNRSATPIFRYRTRDLTRIVEEKNRCKCGRTHLRIDRIKGRSDDMIIFKGVNVFPMQIEQIIMNTKEVANNYVIELSSDKELVEKMNVKIEINPDAFHGSIEELELIKKKILSQIKDEVWISPKIELVEYNSLPVTEGKAKRVIDNRIK